MEDRAKNGASKRAGRGSSFHFSRGQNRKSLSSVFFLLRNQTETLATQASICQTGIKQAVVSIRNLSFLLSDASDWTQYP